LQNKHAGHYKVYNLCKEKNRQYRPNFFWSPSSEFWPYHQILPRCRNLSSLTVRINTWMITKTMSQWSIAKLAKGGQESWFAVIWFTLENSKQRGTRCCTTQWRGQRTRRESQFRAKSDTCITLSSTSEWGSNWAISETLLI
jgi:hypothetical protein